MVPPAKDRMRDNVSKPLDWACAGRVLPQRNVSSYLIVIGGVFRKIRRRCSAMNAIKWLVHSRRTAPIKRSTYPFCQGERDEVGRSRMPIARTRALNVTPNALSLSRIRAHPDWVEIVMRSRFFDFAHVLFGKPVPTFPEHALGWPTVDRLTCGVRERAGGRARIPRTKFPRLRTASGCSCPRFSGASQPQQRKIALGEMRFNVALDRAQPSRAYAATLGDRRRIARCAQSDRENGASRRYLDGRSGRMKYDIEALAGSRRNEIARE